MYEPKTFEELLMGQLNKAIEAMNASSDTIFDGIMESIEILLKFVPPMYNDYIKEKENLYNKALANFNVAEQQASQYQDDMYREFAKSKQEAIISWAFRKDLFEVLVSLMGKYNKIAFTNQEFAAFNQVPVVKSVQQAPEPQQIKPAYQPPQQLQQVQQAQPQQYQQQYQQPQYQQPAQFQQPQQVQQTQEQQEKERITEEELKNILQQNKEKQKGSKYNGLLFGRK